MKELAYKFPEERYFKITREEEDVDNAKACIKELTQIAKDKFIDCISAFPFGYNTHLILQKNTRTGVLRPMINAKLIRLSDEMVSVKQSHYILPQLRAKIRRFKEVEVEYTNFLGQKRQELLTGHPAVEIQKEIDLHNGITIFDRAIMQGDLNVELNNIFLTFENYYSPKLLEERRNRIDFDDNEHYNLLNVNLDATIIPILTATNKSEVGFEDILKDMCVQLDDGEPEDD